MKVPVKYWSVILLLVMVIAGCGGGGGGGNDPSTGGDNSSTTENKLNPNAVILDQNSNMQLITVDTNTLTYSYTGTAPSIKPGDILVKGGSDGYLKKVVSVQDQGGQLVVISEQASIEDAFDELHVQQTITMTDNILQTQKLLSKAQAPAQGSLGLKFSNIKISEQQSYDVDITKMDFNFTPNVDLTIDITGGQLKKFKCVVRGATVFNITTTWNALKALSIGVEKNLLKDILGKDHITFFTTYIPVTVGPSVIPIPVEGQFEFLAGIEYTTSGQIATNMGFDSTTDFSAGGEYNNPTWTPMNTFNYTFSPTMSNTGLASSSAKIYARPKIKINIANAGGPYFDLRPYGKGSLIIDSNSRLEARIGITGNLGGELEIFSKVLASYNYPLFDLDYADPKWVFPISSNDTTAPITPGNLTATAASSSQINLSWTAATDDVGVTGYKIFRAGVYLKTVAITATSDTGLTASTNYCYTVSAIDAANNESSQSVQACATTSASAGDTTAPTVPTNLTATPSNATQINLSWTASTDNVGVTGYKIYKAGVYLKTLATTTTLDTGLTASTNYCYTASAIDAANNESAQSAQACATTSATTTGSGHVPDTGQTTKYTATFGEDADYLINPPSYTDNGNGTITDNVTGLMWQKQDDGTTRTWDAAGTYCNGLTLGGHAGWRLPTDFELVTIVDYGRFNPAINTTYFPNTIASLYWSSTTNADYTTNAWPVNFGYGVVGYGDKASANYVRCVR